MVWLFLGIALAFVLGGILAVRPTGAQKRIAEIRERAIQSGLHVKLPVSLKFPEGAEKGRRPFYCRHLENKRFYRNFYYVQRDDGKVRTSSGDIPSGLKMEIDKILISAHADIDCFYLGNGLLGFSWQESENQEVFDEICAHIDQVKQALNASV